MSCWRLPFQPTRPLRGATSVTLRRSVSSEFQPTRPLRGATIFAMCPLPCACISTHAPLAGRDGSTWTTTSCGYYFNPRAPCGARQKPRKCDLHPTIFQPTRPLRGATISPLSSTGYCIGFQPTRPLRGATAKVYKSLCTFFAITDKFQMLLHRMPPVRAFCSFLMQENHADFGCEPPK